MNSSEKSRRARVQRSGDVCARGIREMRSTALTRGFYSSLESLSLSLSHSLFYPPNRAVMQPGGRARVVVSSLYCQLGLKRK